MEATAAGANTEASNPSRLTSVVLPSFMATCTFTAIKAARAKAPAIIFVLFPSFANRSFMLFSRLGLFVFLNLLVPLFSNEASFNYPIFFSPATFFVFKMGQIVFILGHFIHSTSSKNIFYLIDGIQEPD
jgi:hypothetical protein